MLRRVGTDMMRAWAVAEPGQISQSPLVLVDRPVPTPGPGEVLVVLVVTRGGQTRVAR